MNSTIETPLDRNTNQPGMGRVLTVLIVGVFMPIAGTTIVSIGLPRLINAFGSSASAMQWVMTAYLLALAAGIPIAGWAQAYFGGKNLWLAGLVLFTVGSVLCGMAWNVGSLVAFRVVQGFAAGILLTLMQTLGIQEAKRRGIIQLGGMLATISLPLAFGPIVGPILGGLVLNWLSWPWLFLVNVPVTTVGTVLAAMWLRTDRADAQHRPRLDVIGFLAISGGLSALLIALTNVAHAGGFQHTSVVLPLVIGVALVAFFVMWPTTRDRERTLIDVTLLRFRSVASSSGTLFLVGACMYAAQFLLPLYWQDLRAQSVLAAALLLIPQGVGTLLSRLLAGALTDKFGGRSVALVGFLLTAITTVPFCFTSASTSSIMLSAILFVRGLALGILLVPVMTVAYLDIDEAAVPHASILTRIGQQVGASFGTAIAASVLQSAALNHQTTSEGGFHAAFWAAVIITFVGAAVSLWLPGKRALAVAPAPSPAEQA